MRSTVALCALLAAILAGCGSSGSPAEDRGASPPSVAEETNTAPPDEPATAAPAEPPASEETGKPGETGEQSGPRVDGAPESGSSATELEDIVRAWSNALNADDNEAAADLFAPDALVVQGAVGLRFNGRAGAVRFNSSLPCSGTVVELETEGNRVTALFELGDRPSSACDAPAGTLAAARFVIEEGLITVWQQVPVPGQQPDDDPPPGGTFT